MKKWLKITVTASPVICEPVSDFVIGILQGAVETELTDEQPDGVVHCYFEKENPSSQEIDEIVQRITEYAAEITAIFKEEKAHVSWQLLEDEDWSKTWKAHFSPFFITSDIVIAPTWEKYTPVNDEKVIVMDPGMAFGTGHHATTALALEMVEQEVRRQGSCSVLDVGTGTGVLAIAAVLFGAGDVLGIDNDPIAVDVAGENAVLNTVDTVMRTSGAPVGDVAGQFGLVIANIVHDVLQELADDLAARTVSQGRLILSGVLHGAQVDSITKAFEQRGFTLLQETTRDEWAALLFEK